jgi:hypothetical protein
MYKLYICLLYRPKGGGKKRREAGKIRRKKGGKETREKKDIERREQRRKQGRTKGVFLSFFRHYERKEKKNRTKERERREMKAKQTGKNKDTGKHQTNADSGGLKKKGSPADQVSRVSSLPVFFAFAF